MSPSGRADIGIVPTLLRSIAQSASEVISGHIIPMESGLRVSNSAAFHASARGASLIAHPLRGVCGRSHTRKYSTVQA